MAELRTKRKLKAIQVSGGAVEVSGALWALKSPGEEEPAHTMVRGTGLLRVEPVGESECVTSWRGWGCAGSGEQDDRHLVSVFREK